ncbi:MAG: hypothetical protein M3N52_12080 [Actinomycetota bacterium]|nr:hypothetical protein [Actinomycetota bacterium]
MASGWIYCCTRSATFALIVEDGVVNECAPYVRRWAQGRDAREVWRRLAKISTDLRWFPRRS